MWQENQEFLDYFSFLSKSNKWDSIRIKIVCLPRSSSYTSLWKGWCIFFNQKRYINQRNLKAKERDVDENYQDGDLPYSLIHWYVYRTVASLKLYHQNQATSLSTKKSFFLYLKRHLFHLFLKNLVLTKTFEKLTSTLIHVIFFKFFRKL